MRHIPLLCVLLICTVAFAWVGGDPIVEITSPADTTATPFSILGKCYNSVTGVDYLVLEYWEDSDGDGSSGAADTYKGEPQTTWHKLQQIEDWSFDWDSARLGRPYIGTGAKFVSGSKYLIRIWALDLSGDTSSDTSVTNGISDSGDGSTWADKEVEYITISGEKP